MRFRSWCPSLITFARAIFISYRCPFHKRNNSLKKGNFGHRGATKRWTVGPMVIKGSNENEETQYMFCFVSSACFANIYMTAWWHKLAISVSKCAMFIINMIACDCTKALICWRWWRKVKIWTQPITERERNSVSPQPCTLILCTLRCKLSKFTKQALSGQRPTGTSLKQVRFYTLESQIDVSEGFLVTHHKVFSICSETSDFQA